MTWAATRPPTMPDAHVEPFFATLKAGNPMPVTELEYTSVFELLVAVLLSAQATDVSVNKATRRLFPLANTPARMLVLGQETVESHIRTIGLYRSMAGWYLGSAGNSKPCPALCEKPPTWC